jgi:hypothetical protein
MDAALDELHAMRFVVMDRDELLLLIRSLIRRDEVFKQPNVFKSAASQIYTVRSRPIRAALIVELERLDPEEMSRDTPRIWADLIAWLRKGTANPSANPSVNPSAKGNANPSVDAARSIPDEVESPGEEASGNPSAKGSANPSGNPSRAHTPARISPSPSLSLSLPPSPVVLAGPSTLTLDRPEAQNGGDGGAVAVTTNTETLAKEILGSLEPPSLRPAGRGKSMNALVTAVEDALASGWPADVLKKQLTRGVTNPDDIGNVPAFLTSRVPADPYRAPTVPASGATRAQWCRKCDKLTRLTEDGTPCPTCSTRGRS